MAKSAVTVEVAIDLRSQVDAVATDYVVAGSATAVVTGLEEIINDAKSKGAPEFGEAALKVIDSILDAGANPVRLAETIRIGLADLQSTLVVSEQCSPDSAACLAHPVEAAARSSLCQDPELLSDFVLESREHLSTIEGGMLTLDSNPGDIEALNSVFRGFHTIKGLAGFLEFHEIREVTHEVETVLDLARNQKISVTPKAVDVLLDSIDHLKHAIEEIRDPRSCSPPKQNSQQLIAAVRSLLASGDSVVSPAPPPVLASLSESMTQGELLSKLSFRPDRSVSSIEPASAEPPAGQKSAVEGAVTRQKSVESSVRVPTAKLDFLMDMVGEMVITQSLIRHNPELASLENPKLVADLSQLARITYEVQRTTMSMRMVTIGQVFGRTSRLVRDLSRKAGKQVELDLAGEDTELDKTIGEELTDPLLHMVRNSIDHGIETPGERTQAGKAPIAHIRLAAYHQGGQIVIEIADDGRGLDRDRILAKAQQKGLVARGTELSDPEVFNLIFEPGFSTAAQITEISGRGVGMDVVRKNIQKLRGRIDIESQPGQGTRFYLRLPLTLAIIDGLIVSAGEETYVIPILAVREIVRPQPEWLFTVQGRGEVVMIRENLFPILRLHRRFGIPAAVENPPEALLIVTAAQGQPFCLMVDAVLGKQEVVIKSLSEELKHIPGIAGGAILGNGRVGLILDVEGVFRGTQV